MVDPALPAVPESVLKAGYDDLLHPAAQRAGDLLGRAVDVALSPIGGVVWGFEQIRDHVREAIRRKLHGVPPERIVSPAPTLAGPVLEALRFAGSVEELREMYTSLLARALDRDTAHLAHPSFVAVIQGLSPDEAKLLAYWKHSDRDSFTVVDVRRISRDGQTLTSILLHFSQVGRLAGCRHVDLTPNYLENLQRHGLIELPGWTLAGETSSSEYESLLGEPIVVAARAKAESVPGARVDYDQRCARLTHFGEQFLNACVA